MGRFWVDGVTDLTPVENQVVGWVSGGDEADVATIDGDGRIRAEVLKALCLNKLDAAPDRVVLHNAQVTHRLDLSGKHLPRGLTFKGCSFTQGVDLTSARSDSPIEFVGCRIADIHAERLETKRDVSVAGCDTTATFKAADIEGDLRLTGSRFDQPDGLALDCSDMLVKGAVYLDQHCNVNGKLSLASSHITSNLDCRGGQFHNRSGLAIDATHLIVDGDLICEDEFRAYGEVRLRWAQARAVRFHGSTVSNPGGVAVGAEGLRATAGVYLDNGFQATGSVCLVGARIDGELRCTGGTFDHRSGVAIDASRVAADDMYLDRGFSALGEVRMVGAKLGRQVNCSAGRIDNPSGYALDAASLDCGGGLYLNDEFAAFGQVRLVGATVRDEVNCTAGRFEYPTGDALDADGMATEGHVRLDRGFRAIGGVRLARVTVGRQLTCAAGTIERPDGIALDLTGLVGHGDVELNDGFRAIGGIRAWGATVDRDVSLLNGHLTNARATAFDAHGLRAGGSLDWRLAGPPQGAVDLSFAEVTRLKDNKESRQAIRINLEGFAYRSLDSNLSPADRLNILRRAEYAYQPYQQLAAVYRSTGQDRQAREVIIARERDRTTRGNLRWHARVWNHFLYLTVGYGYRLWLPFVIVAVLGLANSVIYHVAEHGNLIEGTGGQETQMVVNGKTAFNSCPPNYPCFNPVAYSYQLLIPGLNLQQVDKYVPNASKRWGTPLLVYTWLMVLLGWLFGAGLAAGLNRVIRE